MKSRLQKISFLFCLLLIFLLLGLRLFPHLEYNLIFVNINQILLNGNKNNYQGMNFKDPVFINQLPTAKKQILEATWNTVMQEISSQELMDGIALYPNPRFVIGQCALGNILMNREQDFNLILKTLNFPETIQCLFPYAKKLEAEGNWDQAIAIYEIILSQKPDHIPARTNLAEYLYSIGDKPGSAEHYKIIIEQKPTSFSYYRLLQAYRISGETGESAEIAQKAIELYPDDPWLKYEMAEIYIMEGNKEEAVGYLKDLLDVDPDNPRLWYVLCRIYHEIDDIDNSIDACRQAIVVDQDYLDSYLWLSKLLLNQNNTEEALDFAIKLVDKTTDSGTRLEFSAYLNLGDVYIKQSNKLLAIDAYCHSMKLNRWPDQQEYILYQLKMLDGDCIVGSD